MGNDASEVLVASNGHIYVGPTTATAPTDATSSMGTGWVDLGYATEAGVTLTPSQTVVEIMAWQEFYPVRRIVTAKAFDVAFSLLQVNSATLALALGGATPSAGSGSGEFEIAAPSTSVLDERSMALDIIDGVKQYRVYIPKGMVTDLGAMTFSRGAAVEFPITFGAVATGTDEPYTMFAADALFPVGSGATLGS